MKILVLTDRPLSNNNSIGMTFLNIFHELPSIRFASVYCSYGQPDNKMDIQGFQITPGALIANLKNSKIPTGKVVDSKQSKAEERSSRSQKHFDIARKLRWQILFWSRDLLWKCGRWNSPQLRKFLDDFKPDIIFQPVHFPGYLNEIALFIKEYTGVPMVGYVLDDCYTLRQFYISPLYWIDRLFKRQKVKKLIEQCEILYVISDIQKNEYEKIFTPPCKILTKCANFDKPAPEWKIPGEKIRLLYAGNLGDNRWKSLSLIADAVKRLRSEGYSLELNVYSSTPLTRKMKHAMEKDGTMLHPAISYDALRRLQQEEDILIHVEGLSLKSRLVVHQSFSTKLVDYFELAKCIFAVGTEDVASIKHLIDNDAAIVASSATEVYEKLKELTEHRELLEEYGKNAYLCGARNHNKTQMQTMLMEDLRTVCNKG